MLHSYMRCTCERPTNHLNKSEHKKGHGLMHWGAHAEGSEACWHFHTSAEPPPVQHVPSDTTRMRRRVLAHAPCLDFEPWGPPQVCCRFGAARQLGWCAASCSILCLSPLTLPGRILVVLCDQEKPQLLISSTVCLSVMGHCLLLPPTQDLVYATKVIFFPSS